MPVDFTAEFEAAIRELRALYGEADSLKDRLAVRKELKAMAEAAGSDESETLTEIRNHLEPLGLAAEGTPLPELARLAALKITEK